MRECRSGALRCVSGSQRDDAVLRLAPIIADAREIDDHHARAGGHAVEPAVQRCVKVSASYSASCQPDRQCSARPNPTAEPSICNAATQRPSARGSPLSVTVWAGTNVLERNVISRPPDGSTKASRVWLNRIGSIRSPSI